MPKKRTRQFRKVVVGGTFDELHKGHKALLSKAFQVGKYVLIGLTSDAYIAKINKPHKIAPYVERLSVLTDFLEAAGFKNYFEISPLHDSYGLTLIKSDLDAIVVSQETAKMGEVINKRRVEVGLFPLSVITIDLVQAENKKPISTTLIRANEIDENGNVLNR